MPLIPDSQEFESIQDMIRYYIARYRDILPTAAECRQMLDYLQQSELAFYRTMLGEVQFSRSAAMEWIYQNYRSLAA